MDKQKEKRKRERKRDKKRGGQRNTQTITDMNTYRQTDELTGRNLLNDKKTEKEIKKDSQTVYETN